MKVAAIGCGVVVVVLLILGLVVFSNYTGTWNQLNAKFQEVNGAKSHYSAALNTCSQKIQGVWAIADQYLSHESKTFVGVARARSGYDAAAKAFEAADKSGKGSQELTRAGTEAVNAAMAFRVQIEAYPQLQGAQTSQENIRNMEVSVNEIKTALDDWITSIRDYNTFRGSFWPGVYGGRMARFPAKIEYYEGGVKELDVNKLNPQQTGK